MPHIEPTIANEIATMAIKLLYIQYTPTNDPKCLAKLIRRRKKN
jgi:hypothetical protein